MRFQVPQFIEVEDKIFGPLTLKQFICLAGGAGLSFVVYQTIPSFFLSFIPILIILSFSAALAFYKINNKPFIDFLESAFLFYTKQNLYIWKKEAKIAKSKAPTTTEPAQVYVPRLSDSKLKELSWTLDINENLNPLTGEDGRVTK